MLQDETEKQRRENELLKSLDDYLETIKTLRKTQCGTNKADKKIDETLLVLATAVKEKVDYIVEGSRPYRRKQKWFSRWLDKLAEKRAAREEKRAIKQAEMEEKRAAEAERKTQEEMRKEQAKAAEKQGEEAQESEENKTAQLEHQNAESARLEQSSLSQPRLLEQQTPVEVVDEQQTAPHKEE